MIRYSITLTIIAAILFLAAAPAQAQATAEPVHETIPLAQGAWSIPGHKIEVVTLKDPDVRRTCRVQEFKTDSILCSRRFHSQPKVYRAEDLAALIDPVAPAHVWLYFTGFLGAGAGVITGACSLASITVIGAIPVAIVGGFLLLMAPLSGMLSDEDVEHDKLLYQRAGTTLAIKLR